MYLKRYIRSINNRFHRSSRLKIDLSYINGVSNRKFRLGREFNDPHSLALKKSRFNEPCFSKDVLSNELCNYINAIKQKSASDILCIDNSKYKTFPYWAAPLPWQDCSIDTNFINFRKNIEKKLGNLNSVIVKICKIAETQEKKIKNITLYQYKIMKLLDNFFIS